MPTNFVYDPTLTVQEYLESLYEKHQENVSGLNVFSGYFSGNYGGASQTGQLTNSFYPLNGNPAQFVTPNQTGHNHDGQYYLLSNPQNYISNSGFVLGASTGNFLTIFQSGQFYSASNPSNYITGLNTGAFITNGQTGNFIDAGKTGQFYASSNPSNYTSNIGFALSSQTGSFIVAGQTGAFYASNNPNNYITGFNSGIYALNSQTGHSHASLYYPLNSNPSGYLTSAPPATGNATIKQTEIDFGPTGVSEGIFTIIDGQISPTSNLIAQLAYVAPTNKDLDEVECDNLEIKCQSSGGGFLMFVNSSDGSYLHDKFKINYLIG